MGLKKAFGKECVVTQSRTMLLEELAILRREITKDVLDKVAFVLQKMGATIVDLANMIVENQQSQHGDPKASVDRTPETTPHTSGKKRICCLSFAAVFVYTQQ